MKKNITLGPDSFRISSMRKFIFKLVRQRSMSFQMFRNVPINIFSIIVFPGFCEIFFTLY